MKKAFISYRRQESEGYVRALYDRLSQHFGEQYIFMDVDDIKLGLDFVDVLDSNLKDCAVLLVVIGREWLDIEDKHGKRRLDNPNDFVRLEVEIAIRRKIPLIPILVHGAVMPAEEQLPDELKPLIRRQALVLTSSSYDYEVTKLLKTMEEYMGKPASPPPSETPRQDDKDKLKPGYVKRIWLLLLLPSFLLIGMWMLWQSNSSPSSNHSGNNTSPNKLLDNTAPPIPTVQAGFDCNKARTDVEKAICASDLARTSDWKLNQMFRRLSSAGAIKQQQEWLKQRDRYIRENCIPLNQHQQVAECIARVYQKRISMLENATTDAN